MLQSLVFTLLMSLSFSSHAELDKRQFTVGSVEVTEIESNSTDIIPLGNNKNVLAGLGEVIRSG